MRSVNVIILLLAVSAGVHAQPEAQTQAAGTPAKEVLAESTLTAANSPAEESGVNGDSQSGSPETTPALPAEIRLREFLVLPRVDRPGRRVLHQDPIDAAIASGDWQPPEAGDTVTAADGREVAWRLAIADPQGRLSGPTAAGGYAFATVDSPADRVMLLQAPRSVSVRVNGDWLAGDPYGEGGPYLPIQLNKGANAFLFHVAQPGFRAKLVATEPRATLSADDATLPDFVEGDSGKLWAAVPIVNATDERLVDAELRVAIGDEELVSRLPAIEPMTVFKAPFRLPAAASGPSDFSCRVALHVGKGRGASSDPASVLTLPLKRVAASKRHTRTFPSKVDGSVQAYSVVPATAEQGGAEPGLILALHDLGTGHAAFAKNFTAKPWAHVVAPQNRRAVGFAWEDWGADDAMEALADAKKRLRVDERRVCVTGHGYGGYGAWRLAMRYPDRFAAVGPSGAKVRFFETSAPANNSLAIPSLLERGARSRAPTGMLRNLSTLGVYLLHGADDRRFPAAESRYMRGRLGDFHSDFVYYERRGAGHWWGPESVDWPGMTDFFRDRRLPEAKDVRRVDFTTAHPSEGSRCHWVSIAQQAVAMQPSRVVIDLDANERAFSGRTENLSLMSLDLSGLKPGRPVTVALDGGKTVRAKWPGRRATLWLERESGEADWKIGRAPAATAKSPRRGGLFKSALGDRVVLVYGTAGSDEENRWAEAKARYDAQTFWRRGNGSLEVAPDADFDPAAQPNRSVVLYGNAETNTAWPALLSTSPVQVRAGRVDVSVESNARPEMGDDLAVLMVRPRPGSATASVAVIGGTGPVGMRLTNRMRFFVPGVAYPDFLVVGPAVLTEGVSDVRAAGYFGNDWGIDNVGLEWRDLAL